MDLVGPGPLEPHFLDADLSLEGLCPTGRWADLGSGAGFPGLVFADRFPGVAVDLVESRQKRATFLDAVLLEAPPRPAPVRVLAMRAEDLEAGVYDGVMARAFAPPEVYLRFADRLLRGGGEALVFLNEGPWTPPSPWSVVSVTPYRVDGKERKMVRVTR